MNNFKTLIHVLFLACANNTYTFINIIMPPYTNPQGQVNCTEKGFGHIGDSEIFTVIFVYSKHKQNHSTTC
jgi:hypothetical protein